jgi:hypothetical protein
MIIEADIPGNEAFNQVEMLVENHPDSFTRTIEGNYIELKRRGPGRKLTIAYNGHDGYQLANPLCDFPTGDVPRFSTHDRFVVEAEMLDMVKRWLDNV